MFSDRNFSLSLCISFAFHLFIMLILSIFVIHPPTIQMPPRLIEVEMLSLERPLVTHAPKKVIKARVTPKPRRQIKSTTIPKKKPQERISTITPPKISPKLSISSVLGGGRPPREVKEGFAEGSAAGGKVRYGVLPMEEVKAGPLFERVEAGEVWGKGGVTTGERMVKGVPAGHIGLEDRTALHYSRVEGRGGQDAGPGDFSGEIDKIPYYHFEGPAILGRGIVYQEKLVLPRWVEEEGKSLRGKLKFWVLPSGEVDRVLVEETFGDPRIDDIAKRTIRRWRFTRGKDEAWGLVSIKIQLK